MTIHETAQRLKEISPVLKDVSLELLEQRIIELRYNPDQPRDPKGSDTGGQWTSGKSGASKLDKYEDMISQQKYETAIVLDASGKTILMKDGNENSVKFTDGEVENMAGKTMTHNHPSGSPFSLDDYDLFFAAKVKEMRAVGKEYVYILKAPEGFDYSGHNMFKYDIGKAQFRVKMNMSIPEGDWKTFNHLTSKEWASSIGLIYERKAR
jgi:hypothetical protein